MFTVSRMENEINQISENLKKIDSKKGYGYYLAGKRKLLEDAVAEKMEAQQRQKRKQLYSV